MQGREGVLRVGDNSDEQFRIWVGWRGRRRRRQCGQWEVRGRGASGLTPAHDRVTQIGRSAKPPAEECRAVVLQLDICGFTTMSQVTALYVLWDTFKTGD